jgi:hypothetical protein
VPDHKTADTHLAAIIPYPSKAGAKTRLTKARQYQAHIARSLIFTPRKYNPHPALYKIPASKSSNIGPLFHAFFLHITPVSAALNRNFGGFHYDRTTKTANSKQGH